MEAEEGVEPEQVATRSEIPEGEEGTGEQEIVLPHTSWISLIGYLQMFGQTEAGAYFREDVDDLSDEIEAQLP